MVGMNTPAAKSDIRRAVLAVTISSEVNVLVLGIMLVLFVVGAPKGLIGLFRTLSFRVGARK